MSTQVILITGASTGFGRLSTLTLARQGHHVFATMRGVEGKNAPHAQELLEIAKEERLKIDVLELDVTDDTSTRQAVNEAIRRAGRLDVIVNNAGAWTVGIAEAYSSAQYTQLLDVNVVGPHRVTRAALPQLRKQKIGLIINVSSIIGRILFPFNSLYQASKFALEAYSETQRYELAPFGIDLVLIQPGAFGTGVAEKRATPVESDRQAAYQAAGADPEQLVAAITQMMNDPKAQQPQLVADAIAKVIATPVGERPARVVVDSNPQPVETLNETAEGIQKTILESLGMEGLFRVQAVS